MRDVVIASAVRTPIGKFGGALADVPAVELGAIVVKEAVPSKFSSGSPSRRKAAAKA